jgi:hypothetical protein
MPVTADAAEKKPLLLMTHLVVGYLSLDAIFRYP